MNYANSRRLALNDFGYPGAIWTLSRVRDLILRNSGYRIAYVSNVAASSEKLAGLARNQ